MKLSSLSNNIKIGGNYLKARKKQNILATLGVLLGVSMFIVLINFMTGVNDFLDTTIFDGNPDLKITSSLIKEKSSLESQDIDFKINNIDQLVKLKKYLRTNSEIVSFSEQLISPSIFISQYAQVSVVLNGIDPIQERGMYDIDKKIIEGKGMNDLISSNKILIGTSLARNLKVNVGDFLRIILPNGNESIFKVVGIFQYGITTIDNVRSYMSLENMQGLLGEKSISQLSVNLKNRDEFSVKKKIEKEVEGIQVEDWKENNQTIVLGNKVRNILTASVSFALLLVAGFGIYNIMNNTVLQKRKDIAILKTIGYQTEDVVLIFITQTLFIGIVGSLLGAILGFLICYNISITALKTTDFLITDTYPMNFILKYYVFGVFFGVLTTFLAGYFPAKRAAAIDPVQILQDTL